METKFNVFGDRVLVKPDTPKEVTKGGIIIPQAAQTRTFWGRVVGKGQEVDIAGIEVGTHVFYDRHGGTVVVIDGVDHIIIKQTDILGGEPSTIE